MKPIDFMGWMKFHQQKCNVLNITHLADNLTLWGQHHLILSQAPLKFLSSHYVSHQALGCHEPWNTALNIKHARGPRSGKHSIQLHREAIPRKWRAFHYKSSQTLTLSRLLSELKQYDFLLFLKINSIITSTDSSKHTFSVCLKHSLFFLIKGKNYGISSLCLFNAILVSKQPIHCSFILHP